MTVRIWFPSVCASLSGCPGGGCWRGSTVETMINGFHTIVYSDDAAATRAFFHDVLGWGFVDAGDDWLIFGPHSELRFIR